MPVRVRLSRIGGYRKPEGAVVVARPTRWGNPFRVKPMPPIGGNREWRRREEHRRAKEAVDLYRGFVEGGMGAVTVADVRSELRGKDLACWCPLDQPCHADVLLEIANRAPEPPTPADEEHEGLPTDWDRISR